MRLEPIEKPRSPLLKLVYLLSRRQFGKVLTPLKVIYARSLPLLWVSDRIRRTDPKLSLSPETVHLIRYFVAHMNDCSFCSNLHSFAAAKENVELREWRELMNFRESDRFSDKEKALLAYVEEVNTTRQAGDETFAALKAHYTDQEIVEITWVCATENYYNLLAKPLGLRSDELK